MTLHRFADLVAVPWRNGQGVTRDVVTRLDPGGAMLWQVSIAELVRDGEFSDYAGFDRVFTPVLGDGIALSHDGGPFLPCPVLVPQPFAGERRTLCRVGGGPGRAFNVITARGRHQATVAVLRVGAGAALTGDVLHCWSGGFVADGLATGPGDSLVSAGATASVASVVIQVRLAAAPALQGGRR